MKEIGLFMALFGALVVIAAILAFLIWGTTGSARAARRGDAFAKIVFWTFFGVDWILVAGVFLAVGTRA